MMGIKYTVPGILRELAETVQRVVGYQGNLVFDSAKPDGTPRKLQDISLMHGLGWHHHVTLEEGIRRTHQWYRENVAQ